VSPASGSSRKSFVTVLPSTYAAQTRKTAQLAIVQRPAAVIRSRSDGRAASSVTTV
jgi:hypothetical protein